LICRYQAFFELKIASDGGLSSRQELFVFLSPKLKLTLKSKNRTKWGLSTNQKLKPIKEWDMPVVFVGVLALEWEVRNYMLLRNIAHSGQTVRNILS
jgi:hypothetical protein